MAHVVPPLTAPPTIPTADDDPPPLGPAVVLPPVAAGPRDSGRPTDAGRARSDSAE